VTGKKEWITCSLIGLVYLVEGPADLQEGPYIFFKCGIAGEQTRAGGAAL